MKCAEGRNSQFQRLGGTARTLTLLRPIILCADDFALTEGVSEAILHLAETGRLTAISCMTASALWRHLGPLLETAKDRCDVGLHLTLTDQQPLSRLPQLAPSGRLPRLGRLIAKAFAGRLDRREVLDEVGCQWNAFVAALGRPPDFIDGHQHVHLLPGVRDSVYELATMSGLERRPYLRVCWEAPTEVLARGVSVGKATFISMLSIPMRREVIRLGLATNDSFGGVYGFDQSTNFPALFPRFLPGGGRRRLVMCHPGFVDARLRSLDPLTDQRQREYDYFASERFPADLEAAGCRLARFREMVTPTLSRDPAPAHGRH